MFTYVYLNLEFEIRKIFCYVSHDKIEIAKKLIG